MTTPTTPLFDAAVRAFEGLAFQFVAAEPEDAWRDAPLGATVRVPFRGERTGLLVVRLYGEVLPVLAASMLGEDEAPAEALQHDAAGEIANVICGNVLPAVAGGRAVFELQAPEVVPGGEDPGDGHADPVARVQVGLDGGWADLRLFLDAVSPWPGGAP